MPAPRRVTLLALLALCDPVAGACGGRSEEREVRDTLDRFAAAVAEKDYQAICDDLLDPQLLEKLQASNLPCEVAMRTGLEDVQQPSLSIRRIKVDGSRASASVRTTAKNQPPSEDDVALVKRDGKWRISRLQS